jgi:hypothetical protein
MFKDYTLTEKRVLKVAIILFMVLGFFLINDDLLDLENFNLKNSIGKISESENDVRFKHSNKFVWKKARKKVSVAEGDAIFTGADSTAMIELSDGTIVNIEPNSLVILNRTGDQLELDLKFGQVKTDIAKSIRVKMPCESLQLEGENSSVKLGPDCAIQTLRGKAKYKSKNQIDPSFVQPIQWINYPRNTFVHSSRNSPVKLSWSKIRSPNGYSIETSLEENFSSIDTRTTSIRPSLNFIDYPKTGRFFARVRSYNDTGKVIAESKVIPLNIKEVHPPLIILPQNNALLSFVTDPDGTPLEEFAVNTEWAFAFERNLFEIELKLQGETDAAPNYIPVKGIKQNLGELPDGQYAFRVRSIAAKDQVPTDWSDPASFTVKRDRIKSLAAPDLLTKKLNSPFGSKKKLFAEWEPVRGAKKYRVEFDSNPEFTNPKKYETADTKILIPKPTEPGKYYYRVAGKTLKGSLGPASQSGELVAMTKVPELDPLQSFSVLGKHPNDPGAPKEIPAKWSKANGAALYQVEISKDQNFTDSMKYLSTDTSTRVVADKPGQYFVRVQAVNSERAPASAYSKIQTFNYQLEIPLYTPDINEPANNTTVYQQRNSPTSIWVEWKNVKGAEKYLFEFSKDPQFEKTLYRTTVKKRRHFISKKLSNGVYYYRIQALNNGGGRSNWSETRKLKILSGRNAGGEL